MKELISIQSELKAPKNQRNNFGNYNYRSAEDILEAVKPLLKKYNCLLLLTDDITLIGNRYYIKATATIKNSENQIEAVNALAREEEIKKGMDGAQITGSASSYARKYALNGLFCIDDTKDPDATNKHGKENDDENQRYNDNLLIVLDEIRAAKEVSDLTNIWNKWACFQKDTKFTSALTTKRKGLENASN